MLLFTLKPIFYYLSKYMELIENLNNNYVDQKFLYFGNGAKLFQDNLNKLENNGVNINFTKATDLVLKNLNKSNEVTIVALACGNLLNELNLSKFLIENQVKVKLIGVDFSKEMLDYAEKNAKEYNINVDLIKIDIMSEQFNDFITDLRNNYVKIIFTLLGATLANFNQQKIFSILNNLLRKEDFLFLEIGLRKNKSYIENKKMYFNVLSIIKKEYRVKFLINFLKYSGIYTDLGKTKLKVFNEEETGALHFEIIFKFKKNFKIKLNNEEIILKKDQEIVLQNIRRYHIQTLINYFRFLNITTVDKTIFLANNKHYGFLLLKNL